MMSLTSAVNYPVGLEPQAVVAAYFNNDNYLDLAVANSSSDTISVLLGNGDGTFQPAKTSSAAANPRSLAVGDFNRDGKVDLAVVNNYSLGYDGDPTTYDEDLSNGLSVMLGNGDGSFQAPRNVKLPHGAKATSVAVGDFNEDGTMDLAAAADMDYAYPGDVYPDFGLATVLLGIGGGSFSASSTFSHYKPLNSAVVADFDKDGHQDLLVGTFYNSFDDNSWGSIKESVRVLRGDGEGNVTEFRLANWVIDHGTSMAAVDINGDQRIDLVTADGKDVNLRLGDGAGGFEPPLGGYSYPAGTTPTSLVLGDFDHDGALDVATANHGSNDVSILRGRGEGTFAPPVHFAAGAGTYAVAVGGFNGDGWLDLATANANGNSVSVLINDQSWTPTPPPVSISVTDASVMEGKRGIKYLTFAVSLSAASPAPVTVKYATQDGSATAGSDYQSQTGTLSFAVGETTKTVRIAIYGDSTAEPDESFQLILGDATGNAVISDPIGIGQIVNDDAPHGGGKKKLLGISQPRYAQ